MIKEITPTVLGRDKYCQVSLNYIIYDTKAEKCSTTVKKVDRPFLEAWYTLYFDSC